MLHYIRGEKTMFEYRTVEKQLIEERRQREALNAKVQQNAADTEYMAMMCGVELEMEEEENEQI